MKGDPGITHPVIAGAVTAWRVATGFGLLIALGSPALTQQRPIPPADHTNAERASQQDMTQREIKLRNVGGPLTRTTDPKRLQALTAQLEEDFKRILTLHNEIVRAANAPEPIDYHFVSDVTGEIKKRAGRLQNTLMLKTEDSYPNQEKPAKFDDTQVEDALIALCKYIESFVSNPVIENPGTVDPRQSSRADSDLSNIVELSTSIRKRAERLSKAAK